MNGKPWTEADTATLRRMAGKRPLFEIAKATGHAEITIRIHHAALGLPAYRHRPGWTRRDWLLADAAGLDFQISP